MYQQPLTLLYVPSKEQTEGRKNEKNKEKITRKQTYQNYLYIQSANWLCYFRAVLLVAYKILKISPTILSGMTQNFDAALIAP